MGVNLSILYRGVLSGCNYDCGYCPFAKNTDDRETLSKDASDLKNFVSWVGVREQDKLRILFTPWGEALIRKHYQSALCALSHMKQVDRVSIQTNLSCRLDWIKGLNPKTASLWCTYHPEQIERDRFVAQCETLERAGIPYSVGCVGKRELFADIQRLREKLPKDVYLWINAYKDEGADYYQSEDIATLKAIDPRFMDNLENYPSLGKPCNAGHKSVSIDGDGNIKRCHFIPEIIGNIYDDDIEAVLKPRLCNRDLCDCHIGYVNLSTLKLDAHYKNQWALGRIL